LYVIARYVKKGIWQYWLEWFNFFCRIWFIFFVWC